MGKQIQMNENILNYITQNSLREPNLLKMLREETANIPERNMQILPEQGQFLRLLVKLIKAKHALEIGVFTGYSGLCIAESLEQNGKLIACDISPEWTSIAKKYWKQANIHQKIELMLGNACDSLQTILHELKENYFDFIFVDADKENYDTYYEFCLKLLRPGGLMVIDNTLWLGYVADSSIQDEATVAVRKLNAKLHKDDRIDLSFLPLADGITLIYKK
jgi:O-methyltransferase